MLTPAELAAHLRISERQVQRLAAAGMPRVPVGARTVRYDPAACTAWLQERYPVTDQMRVAKGAAIDKTRLDVMHEALSRLGALLQ